MRSTVRCVCVGLLLLLAAIVLLSCGDTKPDAKSGLIPIEILYGYGDKINPLLSPDGQKIAYLGQAYGALNVHVMDVEGTTSTVLTDDSLYGIQKFLWAGNSDHILFLRDSSGNGTLNVFDVNLVTRDILNMSPFDGVRAQIVGVDTDKSAKFLFSMNLDDPQAYNVFEGNLNTGGFRLIAQNPGSVVGWLADNDLNVGGCLQMNDSHGFDFMVAEDNTSSWRKVISWNATEILSSSPIRFSSDNTHAYVLDARDYNTGRLVKVDLQTGESEVIAEDPVFRVMGAIFNPLTNELQAVTFAGEREKTVVKDPAFEPHLLNIQKLHSGDFFISSRSKDDSKWLIGFKSDNGPVPFYIYNSMEGTAEFLFYHYPELSEYKFSQMEPISFQARDDETIYGYITFPLGGNRQNLPMVVLVHDGPWTQDSWGYRPEAQWLANRGYVCLQVNYRGSTGYGRKFRQAGFKQWGGTMQYDLIDGVSWAISQKYADPERIAIMGQGYGGYAALMASIQNGDMFAAAVTISGYTNLPTLLESIPDRNTNMKLLYYNRVGHLEHEREMLESVSPYNYFDSISIPMLIVHGRGDRQIPQNDITALVESLEKRNIPKEYLLFENEGHGLTRTSNRMLYYQTAESFLEMHVKNKAVRAEK